MAGVALPLLLSAQTTESPNQSEIKPEQRDTYEDPNKPKLHRGKPQQRREVEETEPPPSPATDLPAPAEAPPPQPGREIVVGKDGAVEEVVATGNLEPSGDPLIERARGAAAEFNKSLPNFICDQVTNRYESKNRAVKWKHLDKVEAELVYNGREDYRNIRINGKPLKNGSPEASGSWSIGEFGSSLISIYHPATEAAFKDKGESKILEMDARKYTYTVKQFNSRWEIRFGRSVKPAFSGAVWIDPESGRTLRIEMSSHSLPTDYEIDTVESVVDYGWVNISGEKYLLPTHSENLACFRGTFTCSRNTIDFTNYRKFATESQVLQVESDISFDTDPKDAKKPETTPPQITPAEKKKK